MSKHIGLANVQVPSEDVWSPRSPRPSLPPVYLHRPGSILFMWLWFRRSLSELFLAVFVWPCLMCFVVLCVVRFTPPWVCRSSPRQCPENIPETWKGTLFVCAFALLFKYSRQALKALCQPMSRRCDNKLHCQKWQISLKKKQIVENQDLFPFII